MHDGAYYYSFFTAANVKHQGRFVYNMVAKRTIAPNSELFFSYGMLHWLNELQHSAPNPMDYLLLTTYYLLLTAYYLLLIRNTSLAERAPTLCAKPNEYCTS